MNSGKPSPVRAVVSAALAWAVLATAGCSPQAWQRPDGTIVTGKIDFQKEPETGRTYHLYVPTSYDPSRPYPLVVTAHGTFPFDHAAMQRDRWVKVAEQNNLIVCAPDFDSANGLLGIPQDRPAPELLRDEKATLRIIEELKRRYNIRSDAIMITGWSGGGYPAHFIGMRHPDLFRCIVGRAANFDERLVTDEVADRARHMHVYVFFGDSDLPGFGGINSGACSWYTLKRFPNFQIRPLPGGHDPHQDEAARYFRDVIEHWPSVAVEATRPAGASSLTVRVQARIHDPDSGGRPPKVILWDFGDGAKALGQSALHTYFKPGVYKVFLSVGDPENHYEYAQTWIRVD